MVKTFLKRSKMESHKTEVQMKSMKEVRLNTRQRVSKEVIPKKKMVLKAMVQIMRLPKCLANPTWQHLNSHIAWI